MAKKLKALLKCSECDQAYDFDEDVKTHLSEPLNKDHFFIVIYILVDE